MIVALGGWLVATVATALAFVGWRMHSVRMEAVTRASHELRGPLTAVRLGIELGLRRGHLEVERLRAIDQELGRAALGLDDLGRARRGAAPVWASFDVRALVEDSVEAWRPAAEAVGVALRLCCEASRPTVVGDRLRLVQATGNVIANAIEHGGGMVDVRLTEQLGAVRIEVIDDGPGLPEPVRNLAARAGRGVRGSARRQRRAGRGRGLAIAVAAVEAHGGRLAAAPSEHGARLVLTLPKARRLPADDRAPNCS